MILDWLRATKSEWIGNGLARPKRGRSGRSRSSAFPRLYTATIAFAEGGVMLQAFHASIARHHGEVVGRLRRRFGEEVLAHADIRLGFTASAPIAVALVPASMMTIIRRIEADSASPTVASFVVDIEQRLEI